MKLVIPVRGQSQQQVLSAISNLHDLAVVRIAASAEVMPVLLSNENLQKILATSPESLCLEGLPIAKYRKWAKTHADLAISTTLSLRGMLRTCSVMDLAGQVRAFLSEMEQLAQQFETFAFQYGRYGVAEDLQKLRHGLGHLAASSFEYGDNVRCMDDLQYQILPVLKKLQKVFGK